MADKLKAEKIAAARKKVRVATKKKKIQLIFNELVDGKMR